MTDEQKVSAQERGLMKEQLVLWFWRVAVASQKGSSLLMRYATTEDVKQHPKDRKGFNLYFNKLKQDFRLPDTRLPEDRDHGMGQQRQQQQRQRSRPRVPQQTFSDSEEDLGTEENAEPTVDNKGRVIRGRGFRAAKREVPTGASDTRAYVERKASGKVSISLSKGRQRRQLRAKQKPYSRPGKQEEDGEDQTPLAEEQAPADATGDEPSGSVMDAVMVDDE